MAESYRVAVIDQETGEPLAGVVVEAVKQSDDTVMDSATTGASGVATFTDVSSAARFRALARVRVVYQVERITAGTPGSHTHDIDESTGFPIDSTQHGTQSSGNLHPEYATPAEVPAALPYRTFQGF